MLLQLDDTYRITVDSSKQNLQLERLENVVSKKDKEVVRQQYNIIGYHGSNLKSALYQYKKDSLIVDDSISDISAILHKLDKIDKTIHEVVKHENIDFTYSNKKEKEDE
ncbi:hypothetical protein [Cytobacillus praedii]|uniref:Uncharacterized protein n=1 Tax=Cytobacillus praedii TaxID=1742358 RepID=A0A4R1AT29_9BACI|nr:hypothetical protein [Cytobacillus praedii]TCJ01052.1 hypothetical protein E0Y62_25885 [Cytobacillus praedii]